ncbi:hypothetical protein EYF80_045188 [Liparis tanakae]|uniref:Uncharacterized protein n=1 Tax=Liparis tanakae TaxID=230148 RepID=A0A4Z2FTT0_9TELE|nr:hypothetical protein EYF80_045188 [Liparis tanakae]
MVLDHGLLLTKASLVLPALIVLCSASSARLPHWPSTPLTRLSTSFASRCASSAVLRQPRSSPVSRRFRAASSPFSWASRRSPAPSWDAWRPTSRAMPCTWSTIWFSRSSHEALAWPTSLATKRRESFRPFRRDLALHDALRLLPGRVEEQVLQGAVEEVQLVGMGVQAVRCLLPRRSAIPPAPHRRGGRRARGGAQELQIRQLLLNAVQVSLHAPPHGLQLRLQRRHRLTLQERRSRGVAQLLHRHRHPLLQGPQLVLQQGLEAVQAAGERRRSVALGGGVEAVLDVHQAGLDQRLHVDALVGEVALELPLGFRQTFDGLLQAQHALRQAVHLQPAKKGSPALRERQALDLSLQRAQLLPDAGLPSVQRLTHLLAAVQVLAAALALHRPHLLVAVALQAGEAALEAVQDLGPHPGQPGVQDLLQVRRRAGLRDGPAPGPFHEPLQLAIVAQDHPLRGRRAGRVFYSSFTSVTRPAKSPKPAKLSPPSSPSGVPSGITPNPTAESDTRAGFGSRDARNRLASSLRVVRSRSSRPATAPLRVSRPWARRRTTSSMRSRRSPLGEPGKGLPGSSWPPPGRWSTGGRGPWGKPFTPGRWGSTPPPLKGGATTSGSDVGPS